MTRYSAEVLETISPPESWKIVKVGVFAHDDKGKRLIGEYERNYGTFFSTFFHFRKNNKDYALYSPNYSATRIMELPSCKDIGGEEPHTHGFCPIEFYVPWEKQDPEGFPEQCTTADIGFVAGCIWGDDNTYKIQYLDLTKAEDGIINRDDRFGYIIKPEELSLAEAIYFDLEEGDLEDKDLCKTIKITTVQEFDIETGEAEK